MSAEGTTTAPNPSTTVVSATPAQPPAPPSPAPAPEAPKIEPSATLLAGKFKSPEDLEKAYKELEKKLGKPPEQRAEPEPASIDELIGKAGLKLDDLKVAYAKDGKLSDDHYKAFQAIGRSRAEIDALAEGMVAKEAVRTMQVQQAVTEAASAIGGKEQLDQLLKDAKQFVPEQDIGTYNQMLSDPATVRAAVVKLAALRAAWAGTAGSNGLVNGQHGGAIAYPKTTGEWRATFDKAMAGDRGAMETLRAMPKDVIDGWMRFGTSKI
jgi:hypothetical protein